MTLLALVASPTRQRILQLCWRRERPAGEIAARCDVTFGAVSQHLKLLREHRLVTLRRSGRERHYRADTRALGPLATVLEAQWTSTLHRLKTLAEAERPS